MDPLSRRLAAIAERVLPGVPMADIGTDHALLPVDMVRRGVVPRAVAIDLAPGPLDRARRAIRDQADHIDLRQGDGLGVLKPGEVGTVVISGMGGLRIVGILQRGRQIVQTLKRVVVQANGGESEVRAFMLALGWDEVDATLVEDRAQFYTVEAWEPTSEARSWAAEDLRWGWTIRARPDPLLAAMLARERTGLQRALDAILTDGKAPTEDRERLVRATERIDAELQRLG